MIQLVFALQLAPNCTIDTECVESSYCDTNGHTCVECFEDQHCENQPLAKTCIRNYCVQKCITNEICSTSDIQKFCSFADGFCVECENVSNCNASSALGQHLACIKNEQHASKNTCGSCLIPSQSPCQFEEFLNNDIADTYKCVSVGLLKNYCVQACPSDAPYLNLQSHNCQLCYENSQCPPSSLCVTNHPNNGKLTGQCVVPSAENCTIANPLFPIFDKNSCRACNFGVECNELFNRTGENDTFFCIKKLGCIDSKCENKSLPLKANEKALCSPCSASLRCSGVKLQNTLCVIVGELQGQCVAKCPSDAPNIFNTLCQAPCVDDAHCKQLFNDSRYKCGDAGLCLLPENSSNCQKIDFNLPLFDEVSQKCVSCISNNQGINCSLLNQKYCILEGQFEGGCTDHCPLDAAAANINGTCTSCQRDRDCQNANENSSFICSEGKCIANPCAETRTVYDSGRCVKCTVSKESLALCADQNIINRFCVSNEFSQHFGYCVDICPDDSPRVYYNQQCASSCKFDTDCENETICGVNQLFDQFFGTCGQPQIEAECEQYSHRYPFYINDKCIGCSNTDPLRSCGVHLCITSGIDSGACVDACPDSAPVFDGGSCQLCIDNSQCKNNKLCGQKDPFVGSCLLASIQNCQYIDELKPIYDNSSGNCKICQNDVECLEILKPLYRKCVFNNNAIKGSCVVILKSDDCSFADSNKPFFENGICVAARPLINCEKHEQCQATYFCINGKCKQATSDSECLIVNSERPYYSSHLQLCVQCRSYKDCEVYKNRFKVCSVGFACNLATSDEQCSSSMKKGEVQNDGLCKKVTMTRYESIVTGIFFAILFLAVGLAFLSYWLIKRYWPYYRKHIDVRKTDIHTIAKFKRDPFVPQSSKGLRRGGRKVIKRKPTEEEELPDDSNSIESYQPNEQELRKENYIKPDNKDQTKKAPVRGKNPDIKEQGRQRKQQVV